MNNLKHPFKSFHLIILFFTTLLYNCNSSDAVEPEVEEPIDLSHLPFGGVDPTNILIRNQGDSQPDYLSLWLCGVPADGAGANNASDWTNADGT